WPTARNSGSRARSGPRTCTARTGSPENCGRARSGSTRIARSRRAFRSAAWDPAASAASTASTRSRTSRRPRPSGWSSPAPPGTHSPSAEQVKSRIVSAVPLAKKESTVSTSAPNTGKIEAVIVAGARTAIGTAFKGSLRDTTAMELAEVVVKEAQRRSGLDVAQFDDIILAESNYGGGDIARHAAVT